jgi:hypothetical protein
MRNEIAYNNPVQVKSGRKRSTTEVISRAMRMTRLVLDRQRAHSSELRIDEIHLAKSRLYAAIEHAGLKAQQLTSIQRMLRELLAIVSTCGDNQPLERKVALQILNDLSERYGLE